MRNTVFVHKSTESQELNDDVQRFLCERGLAGKLKVIENMVFPSGVILEIDCRYSWPRIRLLNKNNACSQPVDISVLSGPRFREALTDALENFVGQQREVIVAEHDQENKKEIESWVVIGGRRVPAKYLADGV